MIETFVRQHLRAFTPYTSARSQAYDAQYYLDANELTAGSPVAVEGIALNRYPDPFQHRLRDRLRERLSVPSDMIFTGVGSDEIIDLLVRLCCDPVTDSIAILEPTYGVYRIAANLNNVRTISIDLNDDGSIDMERTVKAVDSSTKLLFVCSPNNPLGNTLRRNDILALCDRLNTLIVVDQAYVEFADPSADLAYEPTAHTNLVVLRTLSKAWGLAGIRLGYCIAHPELVSYLLRIKSPYNINAVSSHLALAALENESFLRSSVQNIVTERGRLGEQFRQFPFVVKVYPSEANFILAELTNPVEVFQHLLRHGILVRRRNEPRLQNCLRFTIGTHEENSLLLSLLKELI